VINFGPLIQLLSALAAKTAVTKVTRFPQAHVTYFAVFEKVQNGTVLIEMPTPVPVNRR
jgi:hypothetical protein